MRCFLVFLVNFRGSLTGSNVQAPTGNCCTKLTVTVPVFPGCQSYAKTLCPESCEGFTGTWQSPSYIRQLHKRCSCTTSVCLMAWTLKATLEDSGFKRCLAIIHVELCLYTSTPRAKICCKHTSDLDRLICTKQPLDPRSIMKYTSKDLMTPFSATAEAREHDLATDL